jgi:hypothetical protein
MSGLVASVHVVGVAASRRLVELGCSGHAHEWRRQCNTRRTSEGHGASAAPPYLLPSRSSPVALICVGEETCGLGRQLGRFGGLGCPPFAGTWTRQHIYGESTGSSVSGSGWRCADDSLEGHEASTTFPPRSTSAAPSCASEERPTTYCGSA